MGAAYPWGYTVIVLVVSSQWASDFVPVHHIDLLNRCISRVKLSGNVLQGLGLLLRKHCLVFCSAW